MELVKVFNFSDKKPVFLEIIKVCFNLGIGFCITWLELRNYKLSVKTNFKLTSRATLMNIFIYILIMWHRKLSLNCKQHFKERKEHVLIKCLFNKVLPCLFILQGYAKTLLHQNCSQLKKHLFADVLQNSCSWKFCNIHRKTSLLESLFNKVSGIKRVRHKCFPKKCFF